MKRSVKIIRSSPDAPNAYNPADYDDNMKILVGWPGYRTSNNKSGLGYLESQAEWAHMQGLMIRWMITGKFKTRNPVYRLFMGLCALFSVSPLLLLFSEQGRIVLLRNWSFFLPAVVIGVLLLLNLVFSFIRCEKGESITGD